MDFTDLQMTLTVVVVLTAAAVVVFFDYLEKTAPAAASSRNASDLSDCRLRSVHQTLRAHRSITPRRRSWPPNVLWNRWSLLQRLPGHPCSHG